MSSVDFGVSVLPWQEWGAATAAAVAIYRLKGVGSQKYETGGGVGHVRWVLPTANCRLPIADCQLLTANCRLSIADARLRAPNFGLPSPFA